VDVYSFGLILWEIETCSIPFKEMNDREIKEILVKQKLRPEIPKTTDENLSLLIRRCWQDDSAKRSDFKKILSYLENVKFS